MPPTRRSDRARKPRVPWEATITPPRRTRRTQAPAFTIYTEHTEHTTPTEPTKDLGIQLPEDLSTQLNKDLDNEGLSDDKGLDDEGLSDDKGLNDEGLSNDEDFSNDEDLDDEDLNDDEGLDDEGLSDDEGLDDEGLSNDEGLDDEGLSDDECLSKTLSRQLHEDLDVQLPYQPRFPPKDRAGKPQNLPENPDPLKLFQLFFPVKEIENIVKQTNQQAANIDWKSPNWKPLTVTEAYHYLGCLVYIEFQPLQELDDHWGELKSPIASCFPRWRFRQIRRAFTIRDPNTSPQKSGDPWWFRLEPLATTIRNAC